MDGIDRARTHIGLQIPDFTVAGLGPPELFDNIAAQAGAAEQAGFDTVCVMDHFFQLPMIGPADGEMVEAYTLLGALAARTAHVRLGTLVTGVTYRNPALLAKQVTALDVISGGRALLGIGAAWYDAEHVALGFPFPPLRERFERLEDALRICRAMFTTPQATVEGTHHAVRGAWHSPAPVQGGGPPILVGGQGERRTFRLAACYADELNVNSAYVELPRKLDALAGHLADLGRDRRDIAVSCLGTLVVGATHDDAAAALARMLGARGVADPAALLADPDALARANGRLVWGDPDEVGEQVQALRDVGLDGVVFNLVAHVGDPDAVAAAGAALRAALAPAPLPSS